MRAYAAYLNRPVCGCAYDDGYVRVRVTSYLFTLVYGHAIRTCVTSCQCTMLTVRVYE